MTTNKHLRHDDYQLFQGKSSLAIYFILALLMIATRPHHFASALHLPSASLAVFFLLGFFKSRHSTFWLFCALSVSIDLASSYARGSFGDCITRSYPFLAVGYYALWYIGQKCYFSLDRFGDKFLALNCFLTLLGLFIASSFAFLTSNGAYYWLSGKFPDLSIAQYTARVSQYYLPYVQSPFLYVVTALLCYIIAHHLHQTKRVPFVK